MPQKYTIHLNDTAIIFTNLKLEAEAEVLVVDVNNLDMALVSSLVKKKVFHRFVYVVCDVPKLSFKNFIKRFTVIKAAGGMVLDEDRRALFIERKGRWDLPKGKIEVGEKKKKAAVREVEEECGIKVDRLGEKLTITYHLYQQSGTIMLKKTYWYEMYASANQKLVPQKEEDITKVEWFDKTHLAVVLAKTYPSIKKVLKYWR